MKFFNSFSLLLFTVFFLSNQKTNSIIPKAVHQDVSLNVSSDKAEKTKRFYINLIKIHFAKEYGDSFIKFVFDETQNEKESKMIQRYFNVLADYLVNSAQLNQQYNGQVITETEKEMLGEDVYFIIHGKHWKTPNICLWGFNSNHPDEARFKHSNCPHREEIVRLHEAIKTVVNKIVNNTSL